MATTHRQRRRQHVPGGGGLGLEARVRGGGDAAGQRARQALGEVAGRVAGEVAGTGRCRTSPVTATNARAATQPPIRQVRLSAAISAHSTRERRPDRRGAGARPVRDHVDQPLMPYWVDTAANTAPATDSSTTSMAAADAGGRSGTGSRSAACGTRRKPGCVPWPEGAAGVPRASGNGIAAVVADMAGTPSFERMSGDRQAMRPDFVQTLAKSQEIAAHAEASDATEWPAKASRLGQGFATIGPYLTVCRRASPAIQVSSYREVHHDAYRPNRPAVRGGPAEAATAAPSVSSLR